MVAFATPDDLRLYAARSEFTDDQAQMALDTATGLVRSETRQHITRVDDKTVTLRATPGHYLVLPEQPVIAVTTVVGTLPYSLPSPIVVPPGVNGWALTSLGLEYLFGWNRFGAVTVTYSHGYDQVPDDLKAVTLALATRVLSNPTQIRQETIGSYSYTYGGETGLVLTEYERRICHKYRPTTYAMVT